MPSVSLIFKSSKNLNNYRNGSVAVSITLEFDVESKGLKILKFLGFLIFQVYMEVFPLSGISLLMGCREEGNYESGDAV